jgi:hypothetical protein
MIVFRHWGGGFFFFFLICLVQRFSEYDQRGVKSYPLSRRAL